MYWASQVMGWGLFVLGNIITASLTSQDLELTWVVSAFIFVTGILTTHGFRYLFHRWQWKRLQLGPLIIRVLISVPALSLVFTFVNTILVDIWLGRLPLEEFRLGSFLQNSLNFSALFLLWSIIYFAVQTFRNWKNEEIQNLELRASKTEIELNSFKAQMNPHFMFNSLNSIRALIDEDPEKAKFAITTLSGILRNNLMLGKKPVVPLRDELDLVNKYLSLEKIRFEERLHIEMDVAPECFASEIPVFMLQTIVENGIKHGISRETAGGTLSIRIVPEGEHLKITVQNTGQFLPEPGREGIGIANTHKRLELLYGQSASFSIVPQSGIVTAILIIPNRKYQ
ncbi:MAG: LytT sensor histidine kinase [Bacteroidota bacterium]